MTNKPLFHAIMHQDFSKAKSLIESGMDLHSENEVGHTPFWLAVSSGNIELIKTFFTNGVTPNEPLPSMMREHYDSYFDMITNSGYYNSELVDVFLEAGANVKPDWAEGVLRHVVRTSRVEYASYIMDHVADINLNSEYGINYLSFAASTHVSNFDFDQDKKIQMMKALINKGADVNYKDKLGYTPLVMAIRTADAEAVKFLLENGAQVNYVVLDSQSKGYPQDEVGFMPLHLAAKVSTSEIIKLLIAYDADTSTSVEGCKGNTPLVVAMRNNNHQAFEALVESSADIDGKDIYGNVEPLIYAVKNHFPNLVNLLLKHGAEVNFKSEYGDCYGYSPLSIAAKVNNVMAIEALVARGAKTNATGNEHTPLYEAMLSHNVAAILSLIKLTAVETINLPGYGNYYSDVISWDHTGEVLTALLDRGVNPYITNSVGFNLLQLAVLAGNKACEKLLVDRFENTLPSNDYNNNFMKNFLENQMNSSFAKGIADMTVVPATLVDAIDINHQHYYPTLIPGPVEIYPIFSTEALLKTPSKLIQAVINKHGEYPTAQRIEFKHGNFVISSVNGQRDESEHLGNTLNKKQTSKIVIKDAKLFDSVGSVANTTNHMIWIIDHQGQLFISEVDGGVHHSYFTKKHGFGKPVACGGHITVHDGKITEISNGSGHYQPSKDQLILAVKHLHQQNVLANDIIIRNVSDGTELLLQDILDIDSESILAKYPPLEGYVSSKDLASSNINGDDVADESMQGSSASDDELIEVDVFGSASSSHDYI